MGLCAYQTEIDDERIPEKTMSEIKFEQLVDLEQVQQLLETHHRLSDIAYGLFGPEKNSLVAAGWQDILVRYQQVTPARGVHHFESNAYIKKQLYHLEENLVEYPCENGMIDVAMPITINGQHLATFVAGQFFYKDIRPDSSLFVQQASNLGPERETYLKALLRVPICTRKEVHDSMLFLGGMIKALSQGGLNNLKLKNEIQERKRLETLLQKRAQISVNSFACN